jgi:hypothetical protein
MQLSMAILLAALFVAVPAGTASGSPASTTDAASSHAVVTRVIDAGANQVGHYLSLAVPADGRPLLAYHDASAGSLKVARCRDFQCRARAVVTTVHAPGNVVGTHTSIALGADRLPLISHRDDTAGSLLVTACHDRACRRASHRVVDADGDVGRHSSIAIGRDGHPIISYFESAQSASALKVAHCVDPTCAGGATVTRVDVGLAGEYTSLAIGADGLPVISYHHGGNGQLRVAKCQAADCTGSSQISVIAGGPAGEGLFSSIAVPPGGLPLISHVGFGHIGIDVGWALKLARCADAACSAVTANVLGEHVGIRPTSITLGRDGLPLISYLRGSTLSLASCTDSSCSELSFARIDELPPPTGFDPAGLHTAVATGRDGLPLIAFQADGAVMLARCASRTCQSASDSP